jgi:hypothetical protein
MGQRKANDFPLGFIKTPSIVTVMEGDEAAGSKYFVDIEKVYQCVVESMPAINECKINLDSPSQKSWKYLMRAPFQQLKSVGNTVLLEQRERRSPMDGGLVGIYTEVNRSALPRFFKRKTDRQRRNTKRHTSLKRGDKASLQNLSRYSHTFIYSDRSGDGFVRAVRQNDITALRHGLELLSNCG